MTQISRVLYVVFGILAPCGIGGLHLLVHVQDLTTPAVQELLAHPIAVAGAMQLAWHTWGVMSVMMGASFIIIGLLNVQLFRALPRHRAPSVPMVLVMMGYLACVVYVGYAYEAVPQRYGGIVGLIALAVALGPHLRPRAAGPTG
ncbi:MAG: hypothetical protein AAGI71_13925 [Bacteroidota bacterium]